MAQDWTSFTVNIAVKSSMETMYNAWTVASEIEQWFLETCTYSNTESGQRVAQGNEYEWTWYLYDEMERGTIMQANGKDLFQCTFAGNCLVDIHLKEVDDHILVTLTQHNIPTDEQSKFNIRIGCLQGWTFYLSNLKAYYETGHDLRNKNPKLKGINN